MLFSSTLYQDDDPSGASNRDESDIQGADGHIYKGRMSQDKSRFPNLKSHQQQQPQQQVTKR